MFHQCSHPLTTKFHRYVPSMFASHKKPMVSIKHPPTSKGIRHGFPGARGPGNGSFPCDDRSTVDPVDPGDTVPLFGPVFSVRSDWKFFVGSASFGWSSRTWIHNATWRNVWVFTWRKTGSMLGGSNFGIFQMGDVVASLTKIDHF